MSLFDEKMDELVRQLEIAEAAMKAAYVEHQRYEAALKQIVETSNDWLAVDHARRALETPT